MSTQLELVVKDLQKVLDEYKKQFPNSWYASWNANGDFTVVPILAALIQGYSELEKQKPIEITQHYNPERVEDLYTEAARAMRNYGTESGHALNCPADKSDQATCYCK